MKFLFIGHRGSGKSTVLKTLEALFLSEGLKATFLDLDQKIEERYGAISLIFAREGESAFRKLEAQVFSEIWRGDGPIFVATGAGFQVPMLTDGVSIWMRRESDERGRIFLNRPRLEPGQPPLEEWQTRKALRDEVYKKSAQEVLTLPEGAWSLEPVLRGYFSFWFPKLKGRAAPYDVTLLPDESSKKQIYQRARLVEVREDLTPNAEIVGATYFSHRTGESSLERHDLQDWDIALGKPRRDFWSCSFHGGQNIHEAIRRLEAHRKFCEVLKLAPEIQSFEELEVGHQWFLQDPKRHVFLPRSQDGRWRWYRSLFGPRMRLHFAREESGSALDQPFYYETFLSLPSFSNFAAVLGREVSLSLSPSFHQKFFHAKNMPFVSINILPEEFPKALSVLVGMGLRCAAVTSPLKKLAFSNSKSDPLSSRLESANTLIWDGSEILSFNTDEPALQNFLNAHLSKGAICVWGGGGVKSSIQATLPRANFIEARKGQELAEPTQIVWASLRGREVQWPRPLSRVKKVVDLNYSEDSMGLELAQLAGCDYVSGMEFFVSQAQKQQTIWSRYL